MICKKKASYSDYNEKEIKIFKIHRVIDQSGIIWDMNIFLETYKNLDTESNFLLSFISAFMHVNSITLMKCCKIILLELLIQWEDTLRRPLASLWAREKPHITLENQKGNQIYLLLTLILWCMLQQWKAPQIFVEQINQKFNHNSNLENICVPFSELSSEIHLLKLIFAFFVCFCIWFYRQSKIRMWVTSILFTSTFGTGICSMYVFEK